MKYVDEFMDYIGGKGYQVSGNVAAGLLGNHPISFVASSLVGGVQLVITLPMETSQIDPIVKALRKEKAIRQRFMPQAGKECLILAGSVNRKEMASRMDDLQYILHNLLVSQGVAIPTRCPTCGEEHCDVYAQVGEAYRPTHRRCVETHAQASQEKLETTAREGSYLTGLLGAIVGAIVGGIPNVLTIVLTSSAYSLLYALIPLAAYKGYELFKGRRDMGMRWIVIGVSVVGSVLVDLISYAVVFFQEVGGYSDFALRYFLALLREPEVSASLMMDMGTSLLFVGLGIYITWRYISRNNVSDFAKAAQSMDTIIPIPDMLPTGEMR